MKMFFDWLSGIGNAVFTDNTNSDVPGRSLKGISIFGGESGEGAGGGLYGAFGTGATGLLKLIGQINYIALGIGMLLLFMSLFLCVFGLVQASIEGDPRGVAEARTGLITCFISLGVINLVPAILGIIYKMAGIS